VEMTAAQIRTVSSKRQICSE